MKKNTMMRVASALLVAVLLTTCAISGTFAKYISTASGSDIARVAKWSIEVEGTEIGVAGETTVDFNLFDTVNDTDGGEEKDVKDGGQNENIIAPGTTGSFAIDVENLSEVNATYTIVFEETNDGGIPLRYSIDGDTWVDSIDELAKIENKAIAMGTGTATETVYWKWVFDAAASNGPVHTGQTDVTDTALGNAATAATVTIKATITVTQVD